VTDDFHEQAAALADELRPALHRLHRQLRRNSGGDPSRTVSPLQNLLLAAIVEQPGMGVGELARIEKLRGPTISGHIKSMVAAGLVARKPPDSEDRRRIGLLATAKGRASLEASRRRKRDWLAGRLANLSPASRRAIQRAIAALNEIGQ
jgi:DNA-binding MarR family transcriptional regulator